MSCQDDLEKAKCERIETTVHNRRLLLAQAVGRKNGMRTPRRVMLGKPVDGRRMPRGNQAEELCAMRSTGR